MILNSRRALALRLRGVLFLERSELIRWHRRLRRPSMIHILLGFWPRWGHLCFSSRWRWRRGRMRRKALLIFGWGPWRWGRSRRTLHWKDPWIGWSRVSRFEQVPRRSSWWARSCRWRRWVCTSLGRLRRTSCCTSSSNLGRDQRLGGRFDLLRRLIESSCSSCKLRLPKGRQLQEQELTFPFLNIYITKGYVRTYKALMT